MLFKRFSAIRRFFPFQSKRLIRLFWISSVTCLLFISVMAREGVSETRAADTKQIVKQAEKIARKGDLPAAEKLLRQALAQDSNDTRTKLSLSYVLLKQRRYRDSYTISFEVANSDHKNARAYALVGLALLNFGDFRHAQVILENALGLDRSESLGWYGLGMLDFYENRIKDGLIKLESAAYLDAEDSDIIFSLAQVYARDEKYKEAADAYDKFLRISPFSDVERRDRIKGLIAFLSYLGNKQDLYVVDSDQQQTVLPLEIARDRPIVEVTVNNRPEKLRFVLDTGSGISVISDETAARLKINPVSKGGLARAVGGTGKFDIVYGFLKNVNLGNVKVRNVPVYIRKFHDDGEKVDGYIGLSLISKFLTTVDYGEAKFTLTRKTDQATADYDKQEVALPLRLTSSGFLSGEIQLHGIESPLNFIVDTGASISVISSDLAGTSEIKPFSMTEKMRVVGAAGITEDVQSYMLPKVTFGNHTRESIKAIALNLGIINEASGFEQAGILGGNFLKNYKLTFDFQRSTVLFTPIVR